MKIELRPLHPSFGAEVVGVDLARDLDEETIATIQDAWTRFSLLLFRGLRMTPAQHVAFTRRLGSLHVMIEARHRQRMHRTTLEGELPRLARSPRPRPGRPRLSPM
jgi:taurine dioxygenase